MYIENITMNCLQAGLSEALQIYKITMLSILFIKLYTAEF